MFNKTAFGQGMMAGARGAGAAGGMARNTGQAMGGMPANAFGGPVVKPMQSAMKPPVPMQQPMQPAPMPMQQPMQPQAQMQQPKQASESLMKRAKCILVKQAMNPLLNRVLTTGAAGAGLGALGGAVGGGEGQRGAGAVRGAITGGLAGMGLRAGQAGLGAAVEHTAPETYNSLVTLLAKIKKDYPRVTGVAQGAVPAGLIATGVGAGKRESVAQQY